MKRIACLLAVAVVFLTVESYGPRSALAQDSGAPSTGSVTGTITVSKTKVKTTGSKSNKDVVVSLEKVGGGELTARSEHPMVDQKGRVFTPHVLVIQKGTTVDFHNSDTERHGVFCVDDCCKILEDKPGESEPKYMDLGDWLQNETRTYTFSFPGLAVLLCKLHPEMACYIIVLDTPLFTVAEIDGETQTATYTIENVPPGEYVLKVWHKRCETPEQKVTVKPAGTTQADIELVRKKRRRRRREEKRREVALWTRSNCEQTE